MNDERDWKNAGAVIAIGFGGEAWSKVAAVEEIHIGMAGVDKIHRVWIVFTLELAGTVVVGDRSREAGLTVTIAATVKIADSGN